MPFLLDLGLNGHVLAYAVAVAVLAVALFSLAPALHFAVSKTRDGLAEGSPRFFGQGMAPAWFAAGGGGTGDRDGFAGRGRVTG